MIIVSDRTRFLLEFKKYLPPDPIGIEIGVFRGDFSQNIFDIIKPMRLVLIDPFKTDVSKTYGDKYKNLPTAYSNESDYEQVIKRFEDELPESKIVVYKNYSYDAVKHFPDYSLDFLYLDASHLYADVKQDLNDWLPKLKRTGYLCGHDYTDDEVKQAVDQFKEEHKLEIFLYNENGGDWALR